MIVIGLLALRLSVTAKASTAPAASSTRASLTDMPTGPWTLSDVEWFSLRPSSVQMAPALLQLVAMLLTGHKNRAIFDRYNIIHEQELLDAGDQLVAYLAQQAQTPRGRAHPTSPRPAPPLRLVRRTTA